MSYKYAIEKVFNSCNKSYNISDILALYTDSIIRDKKLDHESFEEEMKHIFSIFNCLVDKDIFIKSYT
jgi:predicted metalloprotease with PDZ domain